MALVMSVETIHKLCMTTLTACGASSLHAKAIADNLSAAERDGCKSHGLFRLPAFLKGCLGGLVDAKAVPVVEDVLPGVVRVNAAGGFQQAAQEAGFPELVAKAKSQGVAVMGVVQSRGMSGAMWYPCEQLAEQGLITIVCSNSPGYVAYAPGNPTRVFGTNPMAFGWPRANGHPPYVWDQAASVIARGDVQIALRDGTPLHEGAGIDSSGNLSSDPAEILAGAQLPFGGYKGANLSMMIELLSAAVFGTDLAVEKDAAVDEFDSYNRGLFILGIDASRLHTGNDGNDAAAHSASEHGEKLFQALAQNGSRLAGDRRRVHRAELGSDGEVEVSQALYDEINAIAAPVSHL